MLTESYRKSFYKAKHKKIHEKYEHFSPILARRYLYKLTQK